MSNVDVVIKETHVIMKESSGLVTNPGINVTPHMVCFSKEEVDAELEKVNKRAKKCTYYSRKVKNSTQS